LTHGAPHIKEDSLIEQIIVDFPDIAKVGEDPARPGIMHRLDKAASGLLVIARTADSFDNLKRQFQARTVTKQYIALAYGQFDTEYGDIDFPIARSAQGHKMAALPLTKKGEDNDDGRNAHTEFDVIKQYINYTLLKVVIKTGRTHQIRVHMAAYGRPLVGDDLYATKKTKVKNQKNNLGRIFLHAEKLEFDDLSGTRQKYELELPKELKEFLKTVK
jgi:23S rRNA pseudouridine1911/1915/1917 synthase